MTTKTTHTPGPWYTRHGKISSETSSHGCTLANCNKTANGISDKEVEANARLIAAAPELLEALKNAAIALRFYAAWMLENSNKEEQTYPFGQDCEKKAEAAIAKAEGN